jgi:hypothetical protein
MKNNFLPVSLKRIFFVTLACGSFIYSSAGVHPQESSNLFDQEIIIVDGEEYEWTADLPEPEQTHWDWQTGVYDKHASELVYLDVIYVYSADLTETVEAELEAYSDYANQIFANSKVHIRLRPIGYVRANIMPGSRTNAEENLRGKVATNDEGLATLQYTEGADFLIGIYSRNFRYCGDAPVAGRYGSLAESVDNQMYINVGLTCVREGSTIAHELGHSLGLHHSQRQNPHGGATFPFALGHGVDNTMSTLMAYADDFGTRAWADYYVFSNPHLLCGEVPCGVSEKDNPPDAANAALALNLVRFQAAAYHAQGRPQIPIETAIAAINDPDLKSCIEAHQAETPRTYAGELLEVYCTRKNVSSLAGLEAFEFLRRIDVSHNPLTNIDSLAQLKHLVSFKADDANLQDLTPLLGLKNLERITVNNIAELPCWQLDYFATDPNLRILQRPEQCSTREDDEDFDNDGLSNRVELTAGSNPLIANDEPSVIQFRFAEHAVFESEEEFKLTITRGQGQSSDTSVRLRTIAGTAQADDDFVPLDTTLYFDPYERQKEITVTLINNPAVEEDETFTIELSEAINGTLGEITRAEITIYDANQKVPLRANLAEIPAPQPAMPQTPAAPAEGAGTKSSGGGGSISLWIFGCLVLMKILCWRRRMYN